jgi:hypothetical protein
MITHYNCSSCPVSSVQYPKGAAATTSKSDNRRIIDCDLLHNNALLQTGLGILHPQQIYARCQMCR